MLVQAERRESVSSGKMEDERKTEEGRNVLFLLELLSRKKVNE